MNSLTIIIQIIINSTELWTIFQIFLFFVCFFSFCSGLVRVVRLSCRGSLLYFKHFFKFGRKVLEPYLSIYKMRYYHALKRITNIFPLQPPVLGLLKIVLQLLKEGDFWGILIDWSLEYLKRVPTLTTHETEEPE
jgi:hypothetical protein